VDRSGSGGQVGTRLARADASAAPWLLVAPLVLACASAAPDPRPELAGRWGQLRKVRLDAATAFREARYGEACAALKVEAARGPVAEVQWSTLLQVAARDPSCLDAADGAALAEWGRPREGWRDATAEWDASQGLFVAVEGLSPGSLLTVLLHGEAAGPVVEAAKRVLAVQPSDARACAIVGQDELARGELEAAIARCPTVKTGSMRRLRAAALDEAGRIDASLAEYDAAGFALHGAALLYQQRVDRDDEVERRLDERVPPAALHRAWWDVLRGRPPRVAGLDESPEATLVRALAGDVPSIAALPQLPGAEATVLHARLTGQLDPLDALLAADPDNDVFWRARIGIAVERGLDTGASLAALAERDADHIRLRACETRREAPWAVIAPWSWSALASKLPGLGAAGDDEVGRSWRSAETLPPGERSAALAALQAEHPELRGLARIRAGGSILDGPPSI
jgi:hypothetical protein